MTLARVPLRHRRTDLIFVVFFAVNLVFVSYALDVEQLVIKDPANFTYPVWPPSGFVDAAHGYGRMYDPLLIARPPFWQGIIWIDAVFYGPFYIAAIVAFVWGYDWIRLPALLWAGSLCTCVVVILMEERYGQWATPYLPAVLATNVPWFLVAVALIWRMRRDHPFHRPDGAQPVRRKVNDAAVNPDPGSGGAVLDRDVR